MPRPTKRELKLRALKAVRDYGVNLTRFRTAMSEWAGFNATDMECLRLLFMNGTSTPSALARQTGLTSGAMTALLDRLQDAGLIERRPNPDDRRGTLVSATRGAAHRVASWFQSARDAQSRLVGSYSAAELEVIADVFEGFAALWDDERAKVTVQPAGRRSTTKVATYDCTGSSR